METSLRNGIPKKRKDLRRIAFREFQRNVANKINKIKAKSL